MVLLWQNCKSIRILPNDLFCNISVRELFNTQDNIYKQAGQSLRQHCQLALLYDLVFPIYRGKVIRITNPCSLFHTFYIFFHHRNLSRWIASDPTFMLNILQSLFFLLPLLEWDLKADEMENMAFFYSVNILVSVTNMWGWWKEKCLSRLKPPSIWTLRLHTSFCASVERAKIFSLNQNFFCPID